jgi:hypothetical protein
MLELAAKISRAWMSEARLANRLQDREAEENSNDTYHYRL